MIYIFKIKLYFYKIIYSTVVKSMILDISWISSHSCCEYIELHILFQIQNEV